MTEQKMVTVQAQPRWLMSSIRIPEYWDGKRINPTRERLYKPGFDPKLKRNALSNAGVLIEQPFEVKAEYVPYLQANGFAFPIGKQCNLNLAPEGVSHWPQDGEGTPGEDRKKRIVKLLDKGSFDELVSITGIGEQTVERIISNRPIQDYEAVERILSSKQITSIIKYIETCEEREMV
jgi:hypothetical protein